MVDVFCLVTPILVFQGESYDFWSIKMRTYFCAQDLWDVVNKGYNIRTDISTLYIDQKKELKENQRKDSQALLILHMSLADKLFSKD